MPRISRKCYTVKEVCNQIFNHRKHCRILNEFSRPEKKQKLDFRFRFPNSGKLNFVEFRDRRVFPNNFVHIASTRPVWQPGRPFHNISRASKSVVRRFWTTSNSPISGYWGLKLVKGPVGNFSVLTCQLYLSNTEEANYISHIKCNWGKLMYYQHTAFFPVRGFEINVPLFELEA